MSSVFYGIFAVLIPLICVFLVQPSVAKVALAKNFIAEPEQRFPGLPLLSMGGISMFIGINLSVSLLCTKQGFVGMHDLLAGMIIILFSGFLMDTKLAFRYFRFTVKLLAAIIIVAHTHSGPLILFDRLSSWQNGLLEIGFVVAFMFIYHRLTIKQKTVMLLIGLGNASVLGMLIWPLEESKNWSLLAISLAGSLAGILIYSRYAYFRKKPLPLIGHTGIYLTSLILAALWLAYLGFQG